MLLFAFLAVCGISLLILWFLCLHAVLHFCVLCFCFVCIFLHFAAFVYIFAGVCTFLARFGTFLHFFALFCMCCMFLQVFALFCIFLHIRCKNMVTANKGLARDVEPLNKNKWKTVRRSNQPPMETGAFADIFAVLPQDLERYRCVPQIQHCSCRGEHSGSGAKFEFETKQAERPVSHKCFRALSMVM